MRRQQPAVGSIPSNQIDALEAQANALLVESIEARGRGEYPFYSTSYMRRLADSDVAVVREEPSADPQLPRIPAKVIWRLARRARLSSTEMDLLRLVVGGAELSEAASALRLSRARARSVFTAITRKLAEQFAASQAVCHDDIAQARRETEHPCRYRPEQHCMTGQEACRSTGLCTRRWYLAGLES